MAKAFLSQAIVVRDVLVLSLVADVSGRKVYRALFAKSIKKAPSIDSISFKALRLL